MVLLLKTVLPLPFRRLPAVLLLKAVLPFHRTAWNLELVILTRSKGLVDGS